MPYSETPWQNGQAPALSQDNLRKIERGIGGLYTKLEFANLEELASVVPEYVTGNRATAVVSDPLRGGVFVLVTRIAGKSTPYHIPLLNNPNLAWSRLHDGYYNVAWYGASPTATPQENSDAFHAAEADIFLEGGGKLYVPPVGLSQRYEIIKPIRLRRNIEFFGAGAASRIHNVFLGGDQLGVFLRSPVLHLGNYGTPVSNRLDYRPIQPVIKGQRTITFENAGALAGITEGSLVVIRSYDGDRFRNPNNNNVLFRPRVNRMNRVVGISGQTVELFYPLADSFEGECSPADVFLTGPEIPLTDSNGHPFFTADNVYVHDLSFGTEHTWMPTSSMFECRMERVDVYKTRSFIFGNGYSHCLWQNMRGVFSMKAFETAHGTHNSVFRDIEATYIPSPVDDEKMPFKLGEWVADNVFDNIRINGGNFDGSHGMNITDAYRNTLRNIDLNIPKVSATGIFFADPVNRISEEFPDNPPVFCEDNVIESCRFYMGSANRYINMPDSAISRHNIIRTSEFYGDISAQAVYMGGTENEINQCFFEKGVVVTGPLAPGDTLFRDNTIPEIRGSGNLAVRGTIVNNITPGARRRTQLNVVDNIQVIHSHTAPTPIKTLLIPPETVNSTTAIEVEFGWQIAGLPGAKTLSMRVNGAIVGSAFVIPASVSGFGRGVFRIQVGTDTFASANVQYNYNNLVASSGTASITLPNITSNPILIELFGHSEIEGHAIRLQGWKTTVRNPYTI